MAPQLGEAFGGDVGLYGSEHDVPRPMEALRVYGHAYIFYGESEHAVSFTSNVERHHELLPLFLASRMWSRKPDFQNPSPWPSAQQREGRWAGGCATWQCHFYPPASHTPLFSSQCYLPQLVTDTTVGPETLLLSHGPRVPFLSGYLRCCIHVSWAHRMI